MKVQIIAKNSQEAFDWLDLECQVTGQKMLRFVEKVKVWHYDVLPISADRGETMKAYEVKINDDCQSHLAECDFITVPKLGDNFEFVVPNSFNVPSAESPYTKSCLQ